MNLYSAAHIFRVYDQGAAAIVRLVHRLTAKVEDLEAQLIRSPQPVIAALAKELTKVKSTLARKTAELMRERQLNHQLRRRLRELEQEVERGNQVPVERDSHNSRLPPSLDPPWWVAPDLWFSRYFDEARLGFTMFFEKIAVAIAHTA